MTNYFVPFAAVAVLLSAACSAADPPAPKASPVPPAAAPAKPAGTSSGAVNYKQAAGASLAFSFVQAGAKNHGSFRQFSTTFTWDEMHPNACKLEVTVQIASLDTQDKDRNDTMAGPDLLDAKKFPTARYSADSCVHAGGGTEAVGKLTLHGVTKDLRVPLTIKPAASGLELSGEVTIKRLAFGVGQGDWNSTEMVGDDVTLQYKVPVSRSN